MYSGISIERLITTRRMGVILEIKDEVECEDQSSSMMHDAILKWGFDEIF